MSRAARPANTKQSFGHGIQLYFWTFVATHPAVSDPPHRGPPQKSAPPGGAFSLRPRRSLTRPGSLLRRWTPHSNSLYLSPCQSDPSCDRSIPHTGAS